MLGATSEPPLTKIIYQVKSLDDSSSSDNDNDNENDHEEVSEVSNSPVKGGVVRGGGAAFLIKWQHILNDHTSSPLKTLDEIIEGLDALVYDQPDNKIAREALCQAREFQFQDSINNRQRVKVKKDLNDHQFDKRVHIDYDRTVPDENYRISKEGHLRSEDDSKQIRVLHPPAPKGFGNKRAVVNISATITPLTPDHWLGGGVPLKPPRR